MKIITIPKEKFDEFSLKHPLGSYYQSSNYGALMTKFDFMADYIGIIDNNKLIGVSLILNHQIFMGFKYGYAPRGLLINYEDFEKIPVIFKKLKRFLFSKKYLILKFDPLVIKSVRDKKGTIIKENENINKTMLILKKCGLIHCGFNNYMESEKPRWHAILGIRNIPPLELSKQIDKSIRTKIRKAIKYGIEIYKDNSANVEKIFEYIKNKGNYSIEYYNEFKKAFKDGFEIYYARINTEVYVENSKILYEKEVDNNDLIVNIIQNEGSKGKDMRDILNKKIASDKILESYKKHLIKSTALLKKYPEYFTIGGAIVINHNDKIYLLIEGYDENYNNLCPSFLLKWRLIEKFAGKNIEMIDFNAIAGNFSADGKFSGLNEAKLGYNAKAIEYIGEFNLIVNKPMYSLYRNTKTKYSVKKQKK